MTIAPFRFRDRRLEIIDQTLLPEREEWVEMPDAAAMVTAIARLQVRGAPAIGIAAALSLGQEASRQSRSADRMAVLEEAGSRLIASRPTAVNLAWAVHRVLDRALAALRDQGAAGDAERWADVVQTEALAIWEEDRDASRAMAEHGALLFPKQRRFLTHCNTGGLATGGGGTALAVLLSGASSSSRASRRKTSAGTSLRASRWTRQGRTPCRGTARSTSRPSRARTRTSSGFP